MYKPLKSKNKSTGYNSVIHWIEDAIYFTQHPIVAALRRRKKKKKGYNQDTMFPNNLRVLILLLIAENFYNYLHKDIYHLSLSFINKN